MGTGKWGESFLESGLPLEHLATLHSRILLDRDREVTEVYAVRATPTTFLIGRDGTLRGRAIGPRPWTGPDGRALLRSLLVEPAPAR